MIKIGKKEGLSAVIKKVRKEKDIQIFLEFPLGHGFLHDYNSLKILKKSFPKKRIVFVSKDVSARPILKKLNFAFSVIKDESYLKENTNNLEKLPLNKTSLFEYLHYEGKKIRTKFSKKNQKTQTPKINSTLFPFIFVFAIFFISIFLLSFVFYFAVHKSYIHISPELEVIKIQKNFVFDNSDEISLDSKVMKIKSISSEANLRDSFSATEIDYNASQLSRGIAVVSNELEKDINLRENTRFVSPTGIVYRLQKNRVIQGAKKGEDGKLKIGKTKILLIADIYDQNGEYIGAKGNGNNIQLLIPGLEGELKNRIYAVSEELSGGNDQYTLAVGEDDIEKASENLRIKLENLALENLKKQLREQNELENDSYELLLVGNALEYSDFVYSNSENTQVGDKKKKFPLDGSIKITGYLYNKDFIFSELKNIARKKVINGSQELILIDEKSLNMAFLLYDRSEDSDIRIKATMEIEAIFMKNFDENGFYADNLKNKISGLKKEEAYNILLNSPNINTVEIKNSPFFIQNISTKAKNIFFIRKKQKVND